MEIALIPNLSDLEAVSFSRSRVWNEPPWNASEGNIAAGGFCWLYFEEESGQIVRRVWVLPIIASYKLWSNKPPGVGSVCHWFRLPSFWTPWSWRNPHLMSLGEKQSPPSPHETENVQLRWGEGPRLVYQRHMWDYLQQQDGHKLETA